MKTVTIRIIGYARVRHERTEVWGMKNDEKLIANWKFKRKLKKLNVRLSKISQNEVAKKAHIRYNDKSAASAQKQTKL